MNLHLLRLLSLLAQVTPDSAGAWVKLFVTNLGVPGALLAGILFAGHKGWIRWGREVERERQISAEREAEWVTRYNIMTREKDMWRDYLMEQHNLTDRAVTTSKSAVDQLASMKDELVATKTQLASVTGKAATP
jgi:hypothetical protein